MYMHTFKHCMPYFLDGIRSHLYLEQSLLFSKKVCALISYVIGSLHPKSYLCPLLYKCVQTCKPARQQYAVSGLELSAANVRYTGHQ